MRDTRSLEIKKILKKRFPKAQIKVHIDKYSMGESIYVNTDLVKRERIDDASYFLGYTIKLTERSRNNIAEINRLLKEYESVRRDETGEILSGGNTFLFIESL